MESSVHEILAVNGLEAELLLKFLRKILELLNHFHLLDCDLTLV
jgi:hypothetical protein